MERSTIFKGQIHYKWQCSIAMLNYQRVTTICLLEMMSSSKRCLGNVLLKIPEVLDLPTEKDVLLGPSNCSLKKKKSFTILGPKPLYSIGFDILTWMD
jgi:hypothetical protein